MDSAPSVASLPAIYTAVIYKWELDGQWYAFRIGERVPMLDQAFPHAAGFGFMTASNPGYVPRADIANQNADEALQRMLDTLGLAYRAGFAAPSNRNWRAYNWLIIDPPEAVFDQLGRQFGQTGTLFWRRGEPVRLRMRAARPADMPEHPYIDWLGPPEGAVAVIDVEDACAAGDARIPARGAGTHVSVRPTTRDSRPEDATTVDAVDLALVDELAPLARPARD